MTFQRAQDPRITRTTKGLLLLCFLTGGHTRFDFESLKLHCIVDLIVDLKQD